MSAEFLKKNGIDVSGLDYEIESMVYELLDHYTDAEQSVGSRGGSGGENGIP